MNRDGFLYRNRKTILSILLSVLATLTLIAGLSTSSKLLADNIGPEAAVSRFVWFSFGITYIAYALTQLIKFFKEDKPEKKILRLASCGVSTLTGLALIILNGNNIGLLIGSIIYPLLIISYQVVSFVRKHKVRHIISGVLIILIMFFIILIASLYNKVSVELVYLTTAIVALIFSYASLTFIITEAFSKIKFATLKEIVQRTYTLEIILGLFFLVVSFSFVFTIYENMSYGDALWYCFAIITTIGFGDPIAVTPFGRILSVILGIYGIVVVALITSIIVNFYNETKYVGKKEDEDDKKDELSKQDESENKDENINR